MRNKQSVTSDKAEVVKWAFVFLLTAVGVALYYYYSNVSILLRVLGLLVLAAMILALVYTTNQGRRAWGFAQDARHEIRKVVWPTRPETVQSTILVLVTVFIMGLILWAVDSLLLKLIAIVMGHAGG